MPCFLLLRFKRVIMFKQYSTYKYLIATQGSQPQATTQIQNLTHLLFSKNGFMLLGTATILILIALFGNKKGNSKGKLAKGFFGSYSEKRKAATIGKQQIKARKHNEVTVFLGRPLTSQNILSNLKYKPPLFLPDAQRGIAVMGGPGSGKTFSAIDQALLSIVDQGFPIILYDFKYPTQSKRIAGYAKSKGYKINIFAPGYPESEICNPLDFLKGPSDALMARQFAEVLNRNFKKEGTNASDQFFTVAGDQLTEAILMLAKGTKYPDIMMCQSILSLPDLPERLKNEKANINPWVYASFGQLISVANSEKTVASIIATANSNFTSFMKADILNAFCGKSTIPLNLKGKELLILGLDREKRDVLSPLLATILHLIVNKNVTKERSDPIFLCLDELPTLYLPSLTNWLNENREDGLATLIGFQNIVQLEKIYGKELSRAILGGCASKIVFNPQDAESAKMFAEYLGDVEVNFNSKSRGTSGGKSNVNISEHNQTKKLFPTEEFLKLPTGNCVIINPGFRKKDESYIPIKQKISASKEYLKIRSESGKIWEDILKTLGNKKKPTITEKDVKARYVLCEKLFPEKNKDADIAENSNLTLETINEQQNGQKNNQSLNDKVKDNFEKFRQFI